MWALCTLLSTSACAYFVTESIFEYLSYSVVTEFDIMNEVPTEFPAVTICNINPFMTNISNVLLTEILTKFKMSPSDLGKSSLNDIIRTKYFLFNNAYSNVFTDQQRKMLGLSLDEMLISCTFNWQTCTSKDFVWIYDMIYGNCFIFNSGKDSENNKVRFKHINRAGKIYGLRVDLYLPPSKSIFNFEATRGAHIFINNRTHKPYLFEGVDISVGYQTDIAVNRIMQSKVPYPFSECTNNLDSLDSYNTYLFKETLKNYGKYRQRDCFDICGQLESIKRCGCYIYPIPSLGSTTPCVKPNQIICSYDIISKFYFGNIREKCSECPLECNANYYQYSLSFSEYPSDNYAELMLKFPTNIFDEFKAKNYTKDIIYDKLRRNVASLYIYYDNLKYTKIGQAIKTTKVNLVSNIGGTLGLFLGISFLSLIEFIEIIFHVMGIGLYFKIHNFNKKKNDIIVYPNRSRKF